MARSIYQGGSQIEVAFAAENVGCFGNGRACGLAKPGNPVLANADDVQPFCCAV